MRSLATQPRFRVLAALAAVLALALHLGMPVLAIDDAGLQLQLSPASGAAGQLVDVDGSGPPLIKVQLLWSGSDADMRTPVRNCAATGIWTGTTNSGSLLEHLDIDDTWVGMYMEHYTTGVTVQHMRVGSNVSTGVNCEWADPLTGGLPGCVDNIIQDSTIASSKVGVYLDEGTTRTTVRRVIFRNQWWAAIGDFKGLNNAYYDNDYSGIAPGAVPISTEHVPQ